MDQIGLITLRSAMLRTLRYAYDLHAERAAVWGALAAGRADADGLVSRRYMRMHRRAMTRIDRLIRGEPAFGPIDMLATAAKVST